MTDAFKLQKAVQSIGYDLLIVEETKQQSPDMRSVDIRVQYGVTASRAPLFGDLSFLRRPHGDFGRFDSVFYFSQYYRAILPVFKRNAPTKNVECLFNSRVGRNPTEAARIAAERVGAKA